MNNLRKVLGILIAMILAISGLPALGQTTKAFALNMVLVAIGSDPHAPQQVTAEFKNLSPPSTASSNISFVTLTVDTADAALLGVSTGARIADVLSVKKRSATGVVTDLNATVTPDPDPTHPAKTIAIGWSGSSPVKGQETLLVTMAMHGCGMDTSWSGRAFTGSGGQEFIFNSAQSQQLTDVRCDVLDCTTSDETTAVRDDVLDANGNPVNVFVKRGRFNSDGSCNVKTPVFVNNDLLTPAKRVQLWPVVVEPRAVFLFTADASVTAGQEQKLAWEYYANTEIPAYLSVTTNLALTCNAANTAGDYFPRPYGKLTSAISASDTKIKITATTGSIPWPTSFPTYMVIGEPQGVNEWMVVTKIAGSSWTVTRPFAQPHGANATVLYSPLKVLTAAACLNEPTPGSCPYAANELAKACVLPAPDSQDGAYKIIGIGDPVWSGGEL